MCVLLVEDDNMIGSSLTASLTIDGMAVDWVRDGQTTPEALFTSDHGLVLLDLGLGGMSGLDVLTRMRKNRDNRPVLIITARDDTGTKVQGLDLRADDFIVKPFDMHQLALARASSARSARGC